MAVNADAGKPTYRQTFRRHRILLSMPMVVGMLVAALFVAKHTITYSSTATLWVDTAPPNPSTVGSDAAGGGTSPASAEQALLSELLTTRVFAIDVAKHSALRQYLDGNVAGAVNALEQGQVVVTVEGGQVMQVGYAGPTAEVTRSVLSAILAELNRNSNGLITSRDQAALAYDKAQIQVMSSQLAAARNQVSQYESQHPGANTKTDPTLAALVGAEGSAGQQYAQAITTLSQEMANHDGGGWSAQVIDPPSAPLASAQGKKKMIETIIAGLFGGLLVSLLGAMVLTPARVERWEDELPTAPSVNVTGGHGPSNGSAANAPIAPSATLYASAETAGRQAPDLLFPSASGRRLVLRRPGDDLGGS